MEPDQLGLKAEAQFHQDPPCGRWHFSAGEHVTYKCLMISSAAKWNAKNDYFSCKVNMYKMIYCHLTETFQVHETPPVQETGREFATRSGDIQAVVRFKTIKFFIIIWV